MRRKKTKGHTDKISIITFDEGRCHPKIYEKGCVLIIALEETFSFLVLS